MFMEEVPLGKRVACYRNLHFPGVIWSVKSMDTKSEDYGRVIAHVADAYLQDCTFHVSEAGRGRVLNTKQRNVHASVRGTWHPFLTRVDDIATLVTYNPYKHGTFVTKSDNRPVTEAQRVMLFEGGALSWGLSYGDE